MDSRRTIYFNRVSYSAKEHYLSQDCHFELFSNSTTGFIKHACINFRDMIFIFNLRCKLSSLNIKVISVLTKAESQNSFCHPNPLIQTYVSKQIQQTDGGRRSIFKELFPKPTYLCLQNFIMAFLFYKFFLLIQSVPYV